MRETVEEIDTGLFKTFVYLPEVEVEYDEVAIRARFSNDNAAAKILRDEISREYTEVATAPDRGYHFSIGRAALAMNGYQEEWLEGIPESAIESFSGMGNPFAMGLPVDGEYVVDIGSGAGLDATVAARAVGLAGHVVGVEMTEAMLEKANATKADVGLDQLEFRHGFAEPLPLSDDWADLVISNGVDNLSPKWIESSKRYSACCGAEAVFRSPTSPSRRRSPRAPSVTSTCGPTELPGRCWKQRSRPRSWPPASRTSR